MKLASTSRLVAAAALCLLLGCAASSPSRTGAAVSQPPLGAEPPIVGTEGGLVQVGRETAAYLIEHYPAFGHGRMAVGWNNSLPFINEVGSAFAAGWPRALPLSEIGVVASDSEHAFDQLDPATFSGLVWLKPDILPGPELAAVAVTLRSTNGTAPTEIVLECRPPFAYGKQRHEEEPAQAMSRWLDLPSAPLALGWESPTGYLWAATADRLERLDSDTGSSIQNWTIPPPEDRFSAGPAVLREVNDGGIEKMGWFDLGYAEGKYYVQGASGAFQAGEAIQAFPLSMKLQRFLSAPFDLLAGEFVLTDFRHEELGRFRDMTRFQGPRGSLFAFLRRDGSIGIVQGTDLSVVNGPNLRSASAVSSYGNYLLVASADAPYHVKAFVMTPGFVWESKWESEDLPGPATAICAGDPAGNPTLFIAEKGEGNGGVILRTVLPFQPLPSGSRSTQTP